MIISQALRQHARHRPQKAAIIDRDRTISYRDLDQHVDFTAHRLFDAGVNFGQMVGLSMNDGADYMIMLLALGRLGAVLVPLDPRWTPLETKAVCDNFGADHVLSDRAELPEGWMAIDQSWWGLSDQPYIDLRVTEDAPMLLSLSSGTTGMPKGPRVTHGQFVARFMVYWLDLALNGQDRFVTATPLYFGGGRGFALAMIYAGGTSCLFCPPYKPHELIDFIKAVNGTATFLVPTQLRRLMEDSYEGLAFPTLRVLISSGSALYAGEQRMARETLSPHLYQYYSSTEGGGCSVLTPETFSGHPESVGQPLFGVEVEVVDDDHNPVAIGQTGRLRYRSAASATSYFKGDGAAAFHDGWFYPGDLGAFDEDGFLYLRGRGKDMIIRGGVNIYPGDIEGVLLDLPQVHEAAVVARPSKEFGEEVVAFVVVAGAPDEAALREACKLRLARYKIPSSFIFVDTLPKTSLGKIAKAELVKTFEPT